MTMTDASVLTDAELVAALGRLAGREREATVALIVHLAEFEARRLYEGAGFRTVFQYCMEVLHLTEDATFNRVEAARVARRYPMVVDKLLDGSLSPTTTRMLSKLVTPENHEALFSAAAFKSKRQVEELLAHWFPQPDVAPSVRKLPAPRTAVSLIACEQPLVVQATMRDHSPAPAPAPITAMPVAAAVTPPRRQLVRPLAPERYEFRFTGSAKTREKLRRAQDLLSHVLPSGDLDQVFERALTVLIEDLSRKKYGRAGRPRPRRESATGGDHIPAAVRRAVVERDGGCCAFVSKSGRRCGDRRFLEFHHVIPRAVGGKATVDNITLRCRGHNGHEVDLFFGPGKRYRRDDLGSVERAAAPFRNGTTHPGSGAG